MSQTVTNSKRYELMDVEATVIAYAKARRAVDGHDGPKSGPEFADAIAEWRRALAAFDACAAAFLRDTETTGAER